MLAPLENPTATMPSRSSSYVAAAALDESGQLLGPPREILLVEHALGQPAEEPRRAALEHLAARAQHAGARQERAAQRE